eukprot:2506998-Amphidinium_carterae.1
MPWELDIGVRVAVQVDLCVTVLLDSTKPKHSGVRPVDLVAVFNMNFFIDPHTGGNAQKWFPSGQHQGP